MLTKTQEKGKVGVVMIIIGGCGWLCVCVQVKCERYWPGGEIGSSVTHGSMEVTLSDNTVLADYTVRTLHLHKVSNGV